MEEEALSCGEKGREKEGALSAESRVPGKEADLQRAGGSGGGGGGLECEEHEEKGGGGPEREQGMGGKGHERGEQSELCYLFSWLLHPDRSRRVMLTPRCSDRVRVLLTPSWSSPSTMARS